MHHCLLLMRARVCVCECVCFTLSLCSVMSFSVFCPVVKEDMFKTDSAVFLYCMIRLFQNITINSLGERKAGYFPLIILLMPCVCKCTVSLPCSGTLVLGQWSLSLSP